MININTPSIAPEDHDISYDTFNNGYTDEDEAAFADFLGKVEENPEIENLFDNDPAKDKVATGIAAILSIEKGETPSSEDILAYYNSKARYVEPKEFVNPLRSFSAEEAVEFMKKRSFARLAPVAKEQALEEDRTKTFRYYTSNVSLGTEFGEPDNIEELTEHEGLSELLQFTENYAVMCAMRGTIDEPEAQFAYSLLDTLTFIGEKEYNEASEALALGWRQFLDANPSNEIAVLTEISTSENAAMRKSDDYLFEQIMLKMTDQELISYGPRIKRSVDELTADPNEAKVVLLDDWTISGSQLTAEYAHIQKNPNAQKYLASTEVQLVASTKHWIEYGLTGVVVGADHNATEISVPVKAHFLAHDAHDGATEYGSHITGLHSSVDYDYEESISAYLIDSDDKKMPPMTNIVRPYRGTQSSVVRNSDGTYSRKK